MDFVLEPGVWD